MATVGDTSRGGSTRGGAIGLATYASAIVSHKMECESWLERVAGDRAAYREEAMLEIYRHDGTPSRADGLRPRDEVAG
ncbi:hypothetical protein Dda_3339 [Drechslerella dactyloides]|uniref:Uncharacterized protein n=1 Tax=Drechslerella dactyloides TaxID=74499 RepID=A0AAD6J146_DREDA|nr:hypothetical protein Dda_3339 [Drechslerella dactyloides]